jgi:adenylate cyclase
MRPTYEHERRFLVKDPTIVEHDDGNLIVQAYLFVSDGYVIRVRRTHLPSGEPSEPYHEAPAILAAKGPRESSMREEYELEIPATYAAELIKRSGWKVSKTRYQVIEDENLWDVDVFHGDNEGLVIAECEGRGLASLRVPSWCGREVTGERQYDNESLARQPFLRWSER